MANAIARKGASLSWRLETGNVPEQSRGTAERKEAWDGERNAERDLQEAGGQEVGALHAAEAGLTLGGTMS